MQNWELAVIVAVLGIILPTGLALAVYMILFHFQPSLFMGLVLQAISVSISFETLSEMQHLSTRESAIIFSIGIYH